ncbi:MAG: DMT family transporter [Burkholderiales bacterium]|nr:DMT family transporter [Burkholderiales bacterium]
MKNTLTQKFTYLKLCLTIFFWGGVYHTANYMVQHINPINVAFVRYLITSIILLVILKVRNGNINLAQFKQHWLLLINIGIFGVGLYNLAFFVAEKHTSANMIAIIFSFTPCLSAFLASIIFGQRVTKLGYVGMIIALSGTIGVVNFTNASCHKYFCLNTVNHLSRGEIYAILTCILFSIYSLLNKKATMEKIDTLTITCCASVFGTILLFIATLIAGDDLSTIWSSQLPIGFWIAMLYTAVIGSVCAYCWYSDAIARLGVCKVAVFSNGIPFATVLIGMVILREAIALEVIIYGMVIVAGVLLTNFATNRNCS